MPSDVAASTDPLIGRALEGYRFLSLLGRGGFGAVYLAQHPRLDLQVAVKYMQINDKTQAGDIARETAILTSLSHPNIVRIHDTFKYDDYQLIMMEFVKGGTLVSNLERVGRLDMPTALAAVTQVAEALTYIHNKQILHLDLKPANILLDPQENAPLPRFVLTDFGISRLTRPGKDVSVVSGTPAYMSPEQFGFGDSNPDHRSDIYQLGMIFYQLLVGTLPFAGGGIVECARQHAYEQPVPPSSRTPGLPPNIDQIILRALAKKPGERYQSAAEMLDALRQAKASTAQNPRNMTPPTVQLNAEALAKAREVQQQVYVATMRLNKDEHKSLKAAVSGISLSIVHKDGTAEARVFDKPSILIGRVKEVDLTLNQPTVSRQHAQIDRDASGTLSVTDLASTHGTLLDGHRLPPHQPITWGVGQLLQIEDYSFYIAGVAGGMDTSIKTNEVKGLFDQVQKREQRPRLHMTVTPEIVHVNSMQPQYLRVQIQTENTPTARYTLQAQPGSGIDPRWYTLPADKVIESGQVGTFDVTIMSPPGTAGGGQRYELMIEASADNPAIPRVFQVVKLQLMQEMRFSIALDPGEVTHRRRGKARVVITNNGNYAETFNIGVQAPDRLRITPHRAQAQVVPGRPLAMPLRFQPRRDAFREDRLLFAVMVQTPNGATERANGSYVLPRRMRLRIPWLRALVIGVLIALAVIWFVNLGYDVPMLVQLLLYVIAQVRQALGIGG
ncbi:MAG: FHA domain-containing serine/threonine-protein kinase [Chloroflexota bacterium]|nr:FHA domain-containing serine/threonine-protein kinase [Chloroflexota bacterium]